MPLLQNKFASCLSLDLLLLLCSYLDKIQGQVSLLAFNDMMVPDATPGSDFCTRDHLSKLELVFLFDNSGNDSINAAPRVIEAVNELKKVYQGSKFGVALFSDWECVAWQAETICFDPSKIKEYHHDPEGCYTFHEALTTDTDLIKSRVQPGKIPHYPSGGHEAGVNGIMMTAAEPRMGWTPGNDEIDVNKIIVVVTDHKTLVDDIPKSTDGQPRIPAKGDGTDKCSRMLGASTKLTAKVLYRQGISVFVFLTGKNAGLVSNWKNAVDKIRGVRSHVEKLPETNDVIVNKLKDFVTEVALTSPRVTCADPTGYNTLGL